MTGKRGVFGQALARARGCGQRLACNGLEVGTMPQRAYVPPMASNTQFLTEPPRRPETRPERDRMAREEALIAKAEVDIDAGMGVEDDDVEEWLDSLEHDPNAPLPSPRRAPVLR